MNVALTVTIIVACLGVVGTIAGVVIRRPVTMNEMFVENRALRKEMDDRDGAWDTWKENALINLGIVATALDIVLHYIPIGTRFTIEEKTTIDKARAIAPPILRKEGM
jgi:hypothetical protein